ncbi:MAG: hypothetical protein IJ678_09015 [Kiritimatiellae bacterium]|nr:hypothetical protein [Kiritimatiellia bacterium]
MAAGAVRRPGEVPVTAWGKTRKFVRYDLFDDTFVMEDGIWDRLENRDSVVMVPKSALRPAGEGEARVFGNVMTVSSGNHAVAGVPLVTGAFWDLCSLGAEAQSDVLSRRAVYANVVGDTFEISQRGASTADVAEMDEWLQALGCPMRRIVLSDRVDETLEFYSRRGQEWRIKPLAWTPEEMSAALRASVSRLHSTLRYYHSVKGVRFLTLRNFLEWGASVRSDPAAFREGLRELCGPGPGDAPPNVLLPKFGPHHEVEFFGLPPGAAERTLVPAALDLWTRVRDADLSDPRALADAAERFDAIAERFRSLLADPAYADESSPAFLEAVYRHLTGAVYEADHDALSRPFDEMRTALPGATYTLGNRFLHDGADPRTIAILDQLELDISHGDRIEWVNVYELRSATERVRLGEGKTREIVFKTAWDPLPRHRIEKRLARRSTGYGAYTLARTHAFRALGISYGRHRLLARNDGATGEVHFFTRDRYPGTPFSQLPPSAFRPRDPGTGVRDPSAPESADIVRAVIVLMGSAAAENLVLKKYTPDKASPSRFAIGKEIVEFGYDARFGKEMPLRVRLCSVRGTMGWPDLSRTPENLGRCFDFYLRRYAEVVAGYASRHESADPWALADAFWEGFASRTRQFLWNYRNRREWFDGYNPRLFGDYKFAEKWSFVLWALERQAEMLPALSEKFTDFFRAMREEGGNRTQQP